MSDLLNTTAVFELDQKQDLQLSLHRRPPACSGKRLIGRRVYRTSLQESRHRPHRSWKQTDQSQCFVIICVVAQVVQVVSAFVSC